MPSIETISEALKALFDIDKIEILEAKKEKEPSWPPALPKYKKDLEKPEAFLSHFTDTLDNLINIYTEGKLIPAKNHDYISFEDEPGRISWRYTTTADGQDRKYKFGIVLKTDKVLEKIKKDNIQPYHDIYTKLNSATGVRIDGVYTLSSGKFFIDCSSYEFRTIALIDNEDLWKRLNNKINQINKYKGEYFKHEIPSSIEESIEKYSETYNLGKLELDKSNSWHYNGPNKTQSCLAISSTDAAYHEHLLWRKLVRIKKEKAQELKTLKELEKKFPGYWDALNKLKGIIETFEVGQRRKSPNQSYKDYHENLRLQFPLLIDFYYNWSPIMEKTKKYIDNEVTDVDFGSELLKLKDNYKLEDSENKILSYLIDNLPKLSTMIDTYEKTFNEIFANSTSESLFNLNIYLNKYGQKYDEKPIQNTIEFERLCNKIFKGNHITKLFIDTSEKALANAKSMANSLLTGDFDEKEWRVNLDTNKIFQFEKDDVEHIILPDLFEPYIRKREQSESETVKKFYDFIDDLGNPEEKIKYIHNMGVNDIDSLEDLIKISNKKNN